jgi:hypothetical protein
MFGSKKKEEDKFFGRKIGQKNLNQKLLDQTYETNFQEKYLVAKLFDEKLNKIIRKNYGENFWIKTL